MATPLFKGSNSFRLVSDDENENRSGLDQYRAVFKGKYSDLQAEKDKWPRNSTGSTLGYSNMKLVRRSSTDPVGPWAFLTLEFEGFISNSTNSEPISISDSITQTSATLVSDETDDNGNDVNVQVSYYAQVTTTRWIYHGQSMPTQPRYPSVLPTTIDVGAIFNQYPAKYPGTLLYRFVGLLSEFRREQIIPGVWAVVESWTNRIEPKTPPRISNE